MVYFRPADILKNSMIKHVPTADRIAFQSAANEALLILVKLASHKAGFHIENITQVGGSGVLCCSRTICVMCQS